MNPFILSSFENNHYANQNDHFLSIKNPDSENNQFEYLNSDYTDKISSKINNQISNDNFDVDQFIPTNYGKLSVKNEDKIIYCNSDCKNNFDKDEKDTSIGSINASELSICDKLNNEEQNSNDETKENTLIKYTYFDETIYNHFNHSKITLYDNDNDAESMDTESIEFLLKDTKSSKQKTKKFKMKFETCSTYIYFFLSIILFIYHISVFYKNNKSIEIYKDFYNMKFELIESSLFMKYNNFIFKILKIIIITILSSISFKLYIMILQRISVPELIHNRYNAKMFFIYSWLYALSSLGLLFYYEEISIVSNLYLGFSDNIIFTFSIIFGYLFISYEYNLIDDIMVKSNNSDKMIIKMIENKNKTDKSCYKTLSFYVLTIVKIFMITCKFL